MYIHSRVSWEHFVGAFFTAKIWRFGPAESSGWPYAVMRTATDQSVDQSCSTVESRASVADKVISEIAITFSIRVEGLFRYWLCGEKCPIRWLSLSKETKHKIDSLFKCQYQAWKGQCGPLCSIRVQGSTYSSVSCAVWSLESWNFQSFSDSVSANIQFEHCFTGFSVYLLMHILIEYRALIHGYFCPSPDMWF